MTTNEAAHWLFGTFDQRTDKGLHQAKWLEAALAAERRATLDEWENECKQRVRDERRDTVERIRERLLARGWTLDAESGAEGDVAAILDEEAAR